MANEFKVKKGLIVTGSGSTIFDVQGSQGQLFSVTDSLVGELFSVNDISGIPIFTVSSDDTINMGTYGSEAIKINGSSTIISNLIITGSTLVSNLNADLLDGNHASYFINTSNIGSQSVSYAMSAGDAMSLGGQGSSYYINTSNISSQSVSYAMSAGDAMSLGGQGSSYYITQGNIAAQSVSNAANLGAFPPSYYINTSNIGSQSVSYAMSAGDAMSFGGFASSYYINTSNIGNQSVSYANLAGDAMSFGGQGSSYYITQGNIGAQSVTYAMSAGDAFTLGGFMSTDYINVNNISAQSVAYAQDAGSLGGFSSSYYINNNTIGSQSVAYAQDAGSVYQASVLYDPYSGGYIQGNFNSYGSFLVSGTRNNYAGLEFTSLNNGNIAIMMYNSSNESGFYNTSYGWQSMWSNGTMYVFKNSYGGGTQATVLDSSNYNSWAVAGSGTNLYLPRFNGTKSLTNSQIYDNGTNVGVNTTSMSGKFHVNGVVGTISIFASGDIVAFSDQSVKTNIRPIDNVLERVVKSRGVIYDRTDIEANDNIGFIAQELEVEFPELVATSEDGTKSVKYQNATAVLFEAVKEQQKQIDELNEKIHNILKLIEK
jgi:hypothetical protein